MPAWDRRNDVYFDVAFAVVAVDPVTGKEKQGGKTIPAIAAINKLGLLFLLNRVTGESIFGVEERAVPQSEVPIEKTSKTQPFPLKPAPLARNTISTAELNTVTPEYEAGVQEAGGRSADISAACTIRKTGRGGVNRKDPHRPL